MTYNYYSRFERTLLKSTTLSNNMGLQRNGSASALQAEGCRFESDQVHHNTKVAQLESSGVLPKDIGFNSYLLYFKGKAKIPTNKCAAYQPKIIYKNQLIEKQYSQWMWCSEGIAKQRVEPKEALSPLILFFESINQVSNLRVRMGLINLFGGRL